ncbi:hypothetical protein PF008_g12212 [Phytophthora fragariae]|uniref:RxLR effector protein n=1 Tax=Phytophthora fragariae TaxID=53985 RepID=A0A6G0RQ23_9STRA|nr:hypothetical protein PF008_g12212 [Phytophthora fragariae]
MLSCSLSSLKRLVTSMLSLLMWRNTHAHSSSCSISLCMSLTTTLSTVVAFVLACH